MPKHAIPTHFRTELARKFYGAAYVEPMYVFAGYSRPRANVPNVELTERATVVDLYRNMLFGKRVVAENDVRLLVRRIPWESGVVYDEYDDYDDLLLKDFFVVVEEGTFYHYWKCISNNGGAESTVAPIFGDLDESDEFYQTSDGYVWKYMCSVTDRVFERHSTGRYSPVEANSVVAAAAVPGSIDHVTIEAPGAGYGNHLAGAFSASDIRVNGNTLTYGIGSNSAASAVNGYYSNCVLYISSGDGVGQYRRVTYSFANPNGHFVVVDSNFVVTPGATSEWEISPRVMITGVGQTINAEARAIINSVGNTVSRVDVLARGAGYRDAYAYVERSSVVEVSNLASVRVVMPPAGGHGSDPATELGATRVSVAVRFSNSELGTIPETNRFQQVGIIKEPAFAAVNVSFSNATGTFIAGENAAAIDVRMLFDGAVVLGNSYMTVSSDNLYHRIYTGDLLYLRAAGNTNHQVVSVSGMSNSSFMSMSANAAFTGNVSVWLASPVATMRVTDVQSANQVVFGNLRHGVVAGQAVAGLTSGAYGVVDSSSRQNVEKGFSTFVGMTRIEANVVSGTFQENEVVYQGSSLAESTSNGYVHSANAVGDQLVMYVTDRMGDFGNAEITSIVGANSGAVATVSAVHDPEVVYGSGLVVHVENVSEVDRSANTSEDVLLVLEF